MIHETSDGATPLDDEDLEGLIPTHIQDKDQLNEWQQKNILNATNWLFDRRHANLVSDEFVRGLHKRMFDETWTWAGQYRHRDTNIGIHWPLIAPRVRDTCENTKLWLESRQFNIDEAAVRFHHALVFVHPFRDGNGRLTRLIADALVVQEGRPRFSWGRTDLRAGTAREIYLAALRAADKGDFSQLLSFSRS